MIIDYTFQVDKNEKELIVEWTGFKRSNLKSLKKLYLPVFGDCFPFRTNLIENCEITLPWNPVAAEI